MHKVGVVLRVHPDEVAAVPLHKPVQQGLGVVVAMVTVIDNNALHVLRETDRTMYLDLQVNQTNQTIMYRGLIWGALRLATPSRGYAVLHLPKFYFFP